MTKVTNPTDADISILYKGVTYVAPANGSVSNVSDEAAEYWQTMIHNFVVLSPDTAEVVKEEAQPIVETDEEVGAAIPEAPKKAKK